VTACPPVTVYNPPNAYVYARGRTIVRAYGQTKGYTIPRRVGLAGAADLLLA
jgi:hypothetical protein